MPFLFKAEAPQASASNFWFDGLSGHINSQITTQRGVFVIAIKIFMSGVNVAGFSFLF
jgi:hypothetical protein